MTRTTFPTCRAHYPGGPDRVPVGSELRFPAPARPLSVQPSPYLRRVGVRIFTFRGLLKLHIRYGLLGCSPTLRALDREAPPWPVSRPGPSQAIKSHPVASQPS